MSTTRMDNACDYAWGVAQCDNDEYLAGAVSAGNKAVELLQYLVDNCNIQTTTGCKGCLEEDGHRGKLQEIADLLEVWN